MNGATPSGRLHPWSWVFFAVKALRELALPLLLVLLLRRDGDMVGLVMSIAGAAFIIGYGVVKSITYRYEILPDEVVIREGVLIRELRHVPIARIQSVSETRGLLHRLLGVTELVLESGSGGKPEAVMQVLDPATAARINALLREARTALPATATATAMAMAAGATSTNELPESSSESSQVLLKLPADELLVHGIVSNRGLLVLGIITGTLAQNAELISNLPWLERLFDALGVGIDEVAGTTLPQLLIGVLVLLLMLFVAMRVLSVIYALVTFHDFTLERSGDRIRVRRGLLTRVDLSGRISGMQRLVLERTMLHRLFRRCSLRVDLASQSIQHNGMAPQLDTLAPIATLADAGALLRECANELDLDALEWRVLHRSAGLRQWQKSLRWLLPAAAALFAVVLHRSAEPLMAAAIVGALATLSVAASLWHAHRWARWSGYAIGNGVIVWRSGVFTQRWVIVFSSRAQATLLTRSPRDRRESTATLRVDTQGTVLTEALRIPFLGEEDAQAINARFWPTGSPHRFLSDSDGGSPCSVSSPPP